MPHHSDRAAQIKQLEGWITHYFNRQMQLHRSRQDDNLHVSRYDTIVGITSPLFVKHLMKRLKHVKSNWHLHPLI